MKSNWVREDYNQMSPYLVCRGGAQAIDFYKQVFGAVEVSRSAEPNGKIMHALLRIGESTFCLCDEFPEWGAMSPLSFSGSGSSTFLYVEDVDATFKRAVAAGARPKSELMDAFWGDRYCALVDPFGHEWQVATHKETLTQEEIMRRARAFNESAAGKK